MVDVSAPDAGHFADPGGGACGEDDDIAPAPEVGRPRDERRGQVVARDRATVFESEVDRDSEGIFCHLRCLVFRWPGLPCAGRLIPLWRYP
jgi:hypothetical protein